MSVCIDKMDCSELSCGVCYKNKAYAMVGSSLITSTYPTCITCYNEQAEPLWIFEYLYKHPEHNIHDYMDMFNTYIDGEYLPWSSYRKRKEET